jgi:hypothetical protein
MNIKKNSTSSGMLPTRDYETAQHFTLSQTFKHRDERAYSNGNGNYIHANNASHDEDEGENNNVNANTVQSALTLVSPL